MEIDSKIIIGILLIGILILLFSNISVSYGNSNNDSIPNTRRKVNNNSQNNSQNKSQNNNITFAESQGFPQKNDLMTNSLKEQIDQLENRYYYNNCKWEPNF